MNAVLEMLLEITLYSFVITCCHSAVPICIPKEHIAQAAIFYLGAAYFAPGAPRYDRKRAAF